MYVNTTLSFDYSAETNQTLSNNGHSLVMTFDGELTLSGSRLNDSEYRLAQMHFHWGETNDVGSEHFLKGQSYPLELHFVHFSLDYDTLGEAAAEDLAVVGVFFEVGAENEALLPLTDALVRVTVSAARAVNMPCAPTV